MKSIENMTIKLKFKKKGEQGKNMTHFYDKSQYIPTEMSLKSLPGDYKHYDGTMRGLQYIYK